MSRTVYAEIPPRVEYALTEMGHGLLPLLRKLVDWADENIGEIKKNRKKFAR